MKHKLRIAQASAVALVSLLAPANQAFAEEASETSASTPANKSDFEKAVEKYKADKQAYLDAMSKYNADKLQYDEKLKEYEKQMADYPRKVEEQSQLDAAENAKREAEYQKAMKAYNDTLAKPGHFASKEPSPLIFEREPNAHMHVEMASGPDDTRGALAMINADNLNGGRGAWSQFRGRLTSEKVYDKSWQTVNELKDNVSLTWNDDFHSHRLYDGTNIGQRAFVAKANQPIKVTYTNLENSMYNGKKIAKVEFEYTPIWTGSDQDTMLLEFADNPTMSVSLYGRAGSSAHPTRVRLTPKFYYEDGTQAVPTEDSPFLFSMGSMNASYRSLTGQNDVMFGSRNLFHELVPDARGFENRDEWMDYKFQEKYGVAWKDRFKDKFFDRVRYEWSKYQSTELGPLWNDSWKQAAAKKKELEKDLTDRKIPTKEWPSAYREIAYSVSNAEFVQLPGSYVIQHEDGIYSDKSVDSIGGWDNPHSKDQYLGAGVLKVTSSDFSIEFGATTPISQLFGLNTNAISLFQTIEPKLELVHNEVPKPEKPVEPELPTIEKPTPPPGYPRWYTDSHTDLPATGDASQYVYLLGAFSGIATAAALQFKKRKS